MPPMTGPAPGVRVAQIYHYTVRNLYQANISRENRHSLLWFCPSMQTSALKAGRLHAQSSQSPSASSPVPTERWLFREIEEHLGNVFALSRFLDVGQTDELKISSGSARSLSFPGLVCLELLVRYNASDRRVILQGIRNWIQDTVREVILDSSSCAYAYRHTVLAFMNSHQKASNLLY